MLANSSAEEKHGNDLKYLFISVQTSFLLSWSSVRVYCNFDESVSDIKKSQRTKKLSTAQ